MLSMHPLTVAELGADFKLEHSLRYGHLPSAYVEATPQRYLEAYVKAYLEEEIGCPGRGGGHRIGNTVSTRGHGVEPVTRPRLHRLLLADIQRPRSRFYSLRSQRIDGV